MDWLPAAAIRRLSRPGSEGNPVRLRAYLRQVGRTYGRQEPSVPLKMSPRKFCGRHVEALTTVAEYPSDESLVTFCGQKVTPCRGSGGKPCGQRQKRALAQRELPKQILLLNHQTRNRTCQIPSIILFLPPRNEIHWQKQQRKKPR